NGGPSDAAAPVTVTDTLPVGLSFVSATGTGWTCSAVLAVVTCTHAAALVAGTDAAPITLTVSVASSVLPQVLVNSATVKSPTADPNNDNNTATDPTQVVTSADISIVKSHTGSFTAGSQGTYTLQVHNAGPSDAAAPVTVTDPLPAGMSFVSGTGTGWSCGAAANVVTCTLATSLPSGGNAPITLIVAVASGVTGSLTNSASVTSPTSDPNPNNNHSTDTTAITTSADISIVKTHLGSFTAGTQGDYTLQVHNAGPSDAALPLTVTDNLPTGMTYVNATGTDWTCGAVLQTVTCHALVPLHAGADATPIILTVAISASQPPGTLVNHASVVSATTDPNPGNNSSEDRTTIVTSADLVMSKHHSNPLVAGMQATYVLSARNNGPSDAAGPLQIVDTLPAGTSFVSASGPGWTCVDASAVVTCTTPAGLALGATSNEIDLTVAIASSVTGSIANTATVSSPTPDPDLANNTAVDVGDVAVVADLILSKTHGLDAVVAGTQLTYTLGVRNEGPSDSGAPVVVTDTLPSGETFVSGTGAGWSCAASAAVVTCTTSVPVPAGADAPALQLTVAVSPGATGTLTNNASVSGPATDPNPDNNHASDPVTVTQLADLTLTKQLTGTLVAGAIAAYLLTVGNLGPSDAAGPITVIDQLPNGLSYVSSSGGSWSCTSSGQTVTCSQSSGLAVGAESSLTLTVKVSASVGTSLTNHATVTSPTPDPLPDNNVAAVNAGVEAASVGPGPLPPDTGQASAQPRWRVGIPLVVLGILLVMVAWGGRRRRPI
ncbi:MAG TPA: DUF11 domain-containing protein, partial [Candidatus Dormibacteraeota bacterium]